MTTQPATDVRLVTAILEQVMEDLSMLTGHGITMGEISADRPGERVSGTDVVHISFKLAFEGPAGRGHGCILIPLVDAITLANVFMLNPPDVVKAGREAELMDGSTKDALLEIGGFIGAAAGRRLQKSGPEWAVTSEGCQGVPAGVPPSFEFTEGDDLIVGRAQVTAEAFPPFEVMLIMPDLGDLPA